MKIGRKIKYFREKMGVTQSHLAEKLNVSHQAVSKWETESSYPDIALIPALAEYLQVSCDALLKDSEKTEKEILGELLKEKYNQDVVSSNDFFARVATLEDALERFPYSYGLMLNLAYTYSSGTMYPEFKTLGWQNRIIDYCERIYANSDELHEKYDAMTLLCYAYNGIDNDRIIEIANEMPEIYQSKSALIYHGYEGKQKFEGMYNYFIELLETSHSMLCCFAGDNIEINSMYKEIKDYASDRDLWTPYI